MSLVSESTLQSGNASLLSRFESRFNIWSDAKALLQNIIDSKQHYLGLPSVNGQVPSFDTSGNVTFITLSSGSGTIGSGLTNQVAWYSANGTTVSGLATANNGILVTSGSGAPSIGLTLPNVVQANITTVGTITSGTWNGAALTDTYIGSASVWNAKQAALISGTNIKTVGGLTVLGSGDLGTIAAIYGGTGQTTYAVGDLLQGAATNTLSKLAAVATGNVLISGGVTTASSWGKVGLTTHVSGLLADANISSASTWNAKESALTFSTGLTRATNTITNNLSTGLIGGQSVIGGTASGNSLTLSSTTNVTKGNILFGTSAYDEVNNRLGIGTNLPTHSITLNSTSTGFVQYNTVDQTTNYERVRQFWATNNFNIISEKGGTGTLRPIIYDASQHIFRINGVGLVSVNNELSPSGALSVTGGLNANGHNTFVVTGNAGNTSGIVQISSIFGDINSTSTSGYRGLFISLKETAVGSGVKLLADFGINTLGDGTGTHTSRFAFTSSGLLGLGTNNPLAGIDIRVGSPARAALRLGSQIIPTAPNGNDIWIDSTNGHLFVRSAISSSSGGFTSQLDTINLVQTAEGTPFTNTETILYSPTVGTDTLTTSYFQAGSIYKYKVGHRLQTNVSGGSIRYRVRIGPSATALTSRTILLDTGASTLGINLDLGVILETEVLVRTLGVSGKIIAMLSVISNSGLATGTYVPAEVTVNTTTDLVLSITAEGDTNTTTTSRIAYQRTVA